MQWCHHQPHSQPALYIVCFFEQVPTNYAFKIPPNILRGLPQPPGSNPSKTMGFNAYLSYLSLFFGISMQGLISRMFCLIPLMIEALHFSLHTLAEHDSQFTAQAELFLKRKNGERGDVLWSLRWHTGWKMIDYFNLVSSSKLNWDSQ